MVTGIPICYQQAILVFAALEAKLTFSAEQRENKNLQEQDFRYQRKKAIHLHHATEIA